MLIVLKSGNLKLLEPSRPVQAYFGIAMSLRLCGGGSWGIVVVKALLYLSDGPGIDSL
jgi:hypothetical protein